MVSQIITLKTMTDPLVIALIFCGGAVFGAAVVLLVNAIRRSDTAAIADHLAGRAEEQRLEDLRALVERMKDSFGALSFDALTRNSREFLQLAHETLARQSEAGQQELEGKKRLIDQNLDAIRYDLQRVQGLVSELEKDREQKFGQLTSQLRETAEQTERLRQTSEQLRNALASRDVRGQWGQRMAEDVLRLAGFLEGINYIKQKSVVTGTTIPDYTFFLPQQLKVNMDVKFPLDNYIQFMEAQSDNDRLAYKRRFLADVRARIKEVTTRDYINPAEHTVDYVLVFIPNEQVYGFINEHDRTVMDDALKQKVILCSPLTLYAILAVIRQAVDNFNLEQTAAQMLALLGSFRKQWEAFVKALEKMGKRIDEAQQEFHTLTGVRRRALERPLQQIEDLRKQRGIEPAPDIADDAAEDVAGPAPS
jgi:DNA recombination protein RmuC